MTERDPFLAQMFEEEAIMYAATAEGLVRARLAHLGYWLCFGVSAGFAWLAFRGDVQVALLFILPAVVSLAGLYTSWDLMTEIE
jgi:hypothetical protein